MTTREYIEDQAGQAVAGSRRSFLKSAALGSLPAVLTTPRGGNTYELDWRDEALEARTAGPNDRIRIATIGMGIIGFIDTATALKVPGIELVAIADLYEGRRIHAKEFTAIGLAFMSIIATSWLGPMSMPF